VFIGRFFGALRAVIPLAAGILLLVAFVAIEARVAEPMVTLSLFRIRAFAAGNAATVKIGFLESFSGVFSDLGAIHKAGAQLALADANARGRVKYEFVLGDDASKPAVATTEARRLIREGRSARGYK